MRQLPLSLRIVLLVLLTSGVVIVAMLVTVYQLLVNDYESLVAERESAEIQRMASELELSLQKRQLTLEAFATTLVNDDGQLLETDRLQARLDLPSVANGLFPDGLLVLDTDATALVESVFVPGRVGTNYADRAHFRKAMSGREPVISEPILGRTTGLPLLSFLQPVVSLQGDVVGYLSGLMDLSATPLIQSQSNEESESTVTTLIIDRQNRMFVSMRERFTVPEPLPAAGADAMVDAAVAVKPSGTIVEYLGERYLTASRQLETLGWVVLRAIPYSEAISPASISYRRFLLISLVALVLVAVAGWWVAQGLTRPIDRITRRIDRMADDSNLDSDFAEEGSPEVRSLARAMNKLVRERKAVEQLKDDFISSVSHELRTPLTSLHGSLKLLHAGVAEDVPGRAKGLVALSLRNSERLLNLVSDLLDFGRLMSGQVELNPVPCVLSDLIDQATADIAPFSEKANVRFSQDIPGGAVVLADKQRLRQVVDNLLSNAIKHSPEDGHIRISARLEASDRWRLTVSDQGHGVPENFFPRIFQRFAQAEHGNRREATGTGLGLAISKGLTRQMAGDIGFFNDNGAHFWIEVPAAIDESAKKVG